MSGDLAIHEPPPDAPAPAVSPMHALIERVVTDPNAPIEKLEKLLEMQERVEAAQARKAYDAAIASARAEIKPILKTARVDYTSQKGRTAYDHETLAGIAEQVDPVLAKHGLSYRYRTDQREGQVYVTCIVAHAEGYREETTLHGAPDASGSKNGYQAIGSAVTYLQRYTLKAALGLAAAKDDDAKGASADAGPVSERQYMLLRDEIEATGSSEDAFLKLFKVEDLHEFPAARFGEAMEMLALKRHQQASKKEAE